MNLPNNPRMFEKLVKWGDYELMSTLFPPAISYSQLIRVRPREGWELAPSHTAC